MKNRNLYLIQYCAAHQVVAYENKFGGITMENRFFNCETIEYVNVSTLGEVRDQLGY